MYVVNFEDRMKFSEKNLNFEKKHWTNLFYKFWVKTENFWENSKFLRNNSELTYHLNFEKQNENLWVKHWTNNISWKK